jgi:hypothetical protein
MPIRYASCLLSIASPSPMSQRSVERLGDDERRLMHLVPAPAVKLMKSRALSRPGMKKCLGSAFPLAGADYLLLMGAPQLSGRDS